jgi:hypothetical protein
VAPLRLGGLRGKQSTPSVWLGGTGAVSTVGERERHRAQVQDRVFGSFAFSYRYAVHCLKQKRKMFELCMIS